MVPKRGLTLYLPTMKDFEVLFRTLPSVALGLALAGALIAIPFGLLRQRAENRFKALFVQRGFVERVEREDFNKWVLFEKNGLGLAILSSRRGSSKSRIPDKRLFYKTVGESFDSVFIVRKSGNVFFKNIINFVTPLSNALFSLDQEKVLFKNPDYERTFIAMVSKSSQKSEWVENFMNKNLELFNTTAVSCYVSRKGRLELEMSKGFFNEKNLQEAERILGLLQNLKLPS